MGCYNNVGWIDPVLFDVKRINEYRAPLPAPRRIRLWEYARAGRDATAGRSGVGLVRDGMGRAPPRRFLEEPYRYKGSRRSRLRAGPSDPLG
jgi:hypothetical protein